MDIENIESLAEGLNKWMKELSETTSLDPVKPVDIHRHTCSHMMAAKFSD
jgi:hypothetical protein